MNKVKNDIILKMRKLFKSNLFMIIIFILGAAVNIIGEYTSGYLAQAVGASVFLLIISFILIVSDNILFTFYPILTMSMFLLKCYDSAAIFVKYWPFGVIGILSLMFHFIYYRKRFVIGTTFWGVLAVAVAVTLGGAGIITKEQYFSPTALYYTIALGFGMLVAYIFLNSHIERGEDYQLNIYFSNILVMMGFFAAFMVLHHYIINIKTVFEGNGVLAFQWRNNIATFLMIALPFPFYKSSENRHLYLYSGVLMFVCLLLTGSRGAMTFGSVEFIMCVISVLAYDKQNRKSNLLIFAVLLGISALGLGKILHFFSDVTNRMTIESGEFDVRIELYKRAVKDFLANPLFGRGLGYMGNRDVHPSTKASLCWYHSLPFQIIGSFGIVGVIGYAVSYFTRFKVILAQKTNRFNITVFLSFAGLEMMSLVNPGEFCPIPYAMLAVIMFIVLEKYDNSIKISV